MYQVLARKWRPKNFSALVGQAHVVKALSNALARQRLHHAYLFTGTRGVGKTTLARILAKSLNCQTGITANPCGQCQACCNIDAGRFIDYIEMDAASTRGVDEMTALLEQAVYACVDARFKIYMIDEVHMLTQHAFNAMLKTLEEPPPHVKFILATTDAQKIPVTVLSRCLQFNLKQMPVAHIMAHLEKILHEEGISFESQAIRLLACAANGSMRDALSLTDQAIAYATDRITEEAMRQMLGILDPHYLIQLLDAIAISNSTAALAIADEMAVCSLSFSAALKDLARLLQRIAWAQFAPGSVLDEWPEAVDIHRFAKSLSPEQVQLYYQIATIGYSELGFAPDEYAGFTMTLLRMFAFYPKFYPKDAAVALAPQVLSTNPPFQSDPATVHTSPSRSVAAGALNHAHTINLKRAAQPKPTIRQQVDEQMLSEPTDTEGTEAKKRQGASNGDQRLNFDFDGNWPLLVTRLPLRGLVKELAMQSELIGVEGATFKLRVPACLTQHSLADELCLALTKYFSTPLYVTTEVGATEQTAAAIHKAHQVQRQQDAEYAMQQDTLVQTLIRTFDAKIVTGSTQPC